MFKIALVARDGYIDLLPRVAQYLKKTESNLEFTFLCHTESDKRHLHAKYGIKDPIIIASQVRSIQNHVDSSCEKLAAFALKYDAVPLIRCMWSTMFEMGMPDAEINREIASHIQFWEQFLIGNQIDVLIYERPSVLSSCIAWLISQKLGIQSIDFIDTVVDTMVITDSWRGDYAEELAERFHRVTIDKSNDAYKRAMQYIHSIYTRPSRTAEARTTEQLTSRRGKLTFDKLCKAAKMWRYSTREPRYFVYGTYAQFIWKQIKFMMMVYLHKFWNVFDTDINPENDEYFLFPLHMSGEWSNHIFMGLGYWDQLTAIKQIAQCLPPWCMLYVKEHRSMYAEHSIHFYREIKKLRNVKLISPFADSFELLKNAEAICTLGSTMGFEAILLNKPVLLMGEPWYRFMPGVYEARTPEIMAELFQHAKTLKVPTEEEKLRIIYALFDMSFDAVKVPRENALTPDNIANLSSALSRYISGMKSGQSTSHNTMPAHMNASQW